MRLSSAAVRKLSHSGAPQKRQGRPLAAASAASPGAWLVNVIVRPPGHARNGPIPPPRSPPPCAGTIRLRTTSMLGATGDEDHRWAAVLRLPHLHDCCWPPGLAVNARRLPAIRSSPGRQNRSLVVARSTA